jgi:hypothetical protein
MSHIESLITVDYRGKLYTVAGIQHAGNPIPVVLDRENYKIIQKLNKKWYINDRNHIYCMHNNGRVVYPVYMHDLVCKLNKKQPYQVGRSILHINNIHFDNRIENLQFDIPDKDYSKNMKKKKRTINLSKHGIDVDLLPTYMWYLKPDQTHGGRFVVDIPQQLSWRSTASKKVSLRYKLEEAKKFLRFIKKKRPDIFAEYSMNGSMTARGVDLYDDYYKLIGMAGFTMDRYPIDRTDDFLVPDTRDLTGFEIYLLYVYDPSVGSVDVGKSLTDYIDLLGSS